MRNYKLKPTHRRGAVCFPVAMFPGRVPLPPACKIEGADISGGLTEICGPPARVSGVVIPIAKTGHGRTVRLHESIHCRHPARPPKWERDLHPMARQALEDLRVHLRWWPDRITLPDSVVRDEVVATLRELRSLWFNRHVIQGTGAAAGMPEGMRRPGAWENAVAVAARSLASVYAIGKQGRSNCCPMGLDATIKHLAKSLAVPRVAHDLLNCCQYIRRGKPASDKLAGAILDRLMRLKDERRPTYDPVPDGAIPRGGVPVVPHTIERLALTTPCQRHSIRWRIKSSGTHIRQSRLVQAALRPIQDLFKSRVRIRGGSVIIDSSGSMALEQADLAALCAEAPAATVAYYAGHGDEEDSHGTITIAAQGGRRYGGTLPQHGSGNAIDLPAIEWLLRQPAPRVFVTDGGFCGGPAGASEYAMHLLRTACADGRVIWVQSAEDARQLFKELR